MTSLQDTQDVQLDLLGGDARCEACELAAARLAYAAGLGASEWEAFVHHVPPCDTCRPAMPAPIGSFVQVGDREWHELDAAGNYVRKHVTTRKPTRPSGSLAENGVDEHGEILPTLPPGSYDPATVDFGF